MKKWLKVMVSVLFAVCLCLALAGCGGLFGSGSSNNNSSSNNSSSGGGSGSSNNENNQPKEDSDGIFIYSGATVKAANTSISGDIVIPTEHNGAPIDTIPANAFKGCNAITSITVPEGITSIGKGAFNGCSSIRSVVLPFLGSEKGNNGEKACFGYIFGSDSYQGGTRVSQYCYTENQYASASYYIPSTLRTATITNETIIGRGAFQNCSMLSKIELNSKIIQVGIESFAGCTKIEEINLPSVSILPSSLFSGCILLSKFTINPSVDTIGQGVFEGCSALASINSEITGTFNIPNTITSIGSGAFNGCPLVKSITLPFVGSQKGNSGEKGCFGYIFGSEAYQGGTRVLQYCYKENQYASASYYIPSALKSVTITNETVIGRGAFQNCSMLESITINSGANNNVGTKAFEGTVKPTWN